MLDQFFISGTPGHAFLWAQHDPWLVALSVLLAVLASGVALQMASLARRAETSFVRQLARASGTLTLGGGIWSMHFISMLAFGLYAPGGFDVTTMALYMLPSLLASWTALGLLIRTEVDRTDMLVGGILLGGAIGTMHYIGMAASHWTPVTRYDPWGFALSLGLAVSVTTLALWVRFGSGQVLHWSGQRLNWAAGGVMGLGIVMAHCANMAALRFIDPINELEIAAMQSGAPMANALAIAAFAIVVGAMVASVNASLRYRQMFIKAQQSESRLRAIAATAVDAIVMIDARGCIQSFNAAAEHMLGWNEAEVLGKNVSMLMPEPNRSQHDGYLANYLQGQGAGMVGVEGRELEALRRDGTLVPIRLTVGRVEVDGDPVFVGFISDQSLRRSMEKELQQSTQQLQSLMTNMPGVAFRSRYDAHCSMLFISDAVTPLTGWLPDDFVEGRVHFSHLTVSEDMPGVWEEVVQAVQEGRSYHVEYRIVDRQGGVRWVSESARPMVDCEGQVQWIDGVVMDMTPFKQRDAEFACTVRAIDRALAVVEFDMQGRVLTANANFLALFGYRLDEVVGQQHCMFCEPDCAQSEDYKRLWGQLRRGELEGGEHLRFAKGGKQLWIHATYNPTLDAQGKPFKVVKFATDLSERRAMEQELRAAKDRAEQAVAARSTFLANMSHEIRTPMSAIIGFTDVLLETPLNPQQQRHMGTVQRSARSMLRLLNDILDTAKLEKGAVELEIADFAPRDLCEQTLASVRILATKKGLDLQCRVSAQVPPCLRGDALRLQQIVLNLLGNALKFTEHGSVELRMDYRDGSLVLEVQDTGMGIAAEQLEHIFDPFAQADASTTRQFGGTGLGTTISRQLAEAMGGSIRVRSTLGVGSTFTVILPLPEGKGGSAPDTAAFADATSEPLPLPLLPLPALRILLVDDVPTNIELLQIHLATDQHQVTVASNGQEAVQAFCERPFDLVLMDLQMPVMDGLEASRRIRAYEQAHQRVAVPIIALSASVLEQDRNDAHAAGMDGFASKPLEPARLFQEMRKVMRQSVGEAAAEPLLQAAVPPSNPAPDAHAQGAIHWDRGTRLWGDRALLASAIARFLREHALSQLALKQSLAQGNIGSVRAIAHRLQGAAGNLALTQLQLLAQRIEAAALSRSSADLFALVAEVPAALQAVEQALASEAAAAAPERGAARYAPLTPAQRTQAWAQALALEKALASAQLAQGPLDLLEQLLPEGAMAPLVEATGRFDFDGARVQLQQLRVHWMDAPTETVA